MPTAGILYPRLTTTKELDFVNYATIGIQIAAALSHHIYQKGAHIDPSGQWHRDSWWSKTTQEQFMSRKSCQAIGPMKVSNSSLCPTRNNPRNPIIHQYEWD